VTLLDRPFLWIRSCGVCYRFALFTRVLLAAAFIPTGMVKLLGDRFTTLGTDNPIGAFFEAMYQTGIFWRFIGLSQVVAAVLLLIPRFAHLGAAIFLPIILNIFILTVSLSFGGTPVITGLMLLAVTYLCIWDYHRFRPMLTSSPMTRDIPVPKLDPWETAGFVVFAVSLMNFFGITRSFIGPELAMVFVATGFAAGFLTLGRFLWIWRTGRLASGVL
jgi:hypothetical protein